MQQQAAHVVRRVALASSMAFLVLAKVIGCQGYSSVWIQLANHTPGCSYLCFVYHVEETQNAQSLSLLSHSKQMSTKHHHDSVLYEICCIRTPGSRHQSCLHGFDKPALRKVRYALDTSAFTRKSSLPQLRSQQETSGTLRLGHLGYIYKTEEKSAITGVLAQVIPPPKLKGTEGVSIYPNQKAREAARMPTLKGKVTFSRLRPAHRQGAHRMTLT